MGIFIGFPTEWYSQPQQPTLPLFNTEKGKQATASTLSAIFPTKRHSQLQQPMWPQQFTEPTLIVGFPTERHG